MTAATTRVRDRVRVVWVTSVGDRVDHAVTADDLTAGLSSRASDGTLGVCGSRFLPAPLVANPGATCMSCARCLQAEGVIRRRDEWVAVPPSVSGRGLAALVTRSPVALGAPVLPRGEPSGRFRRKDKVVSSDDRTAHGPRREPHP